MTGASRATAFVAALFGAALTLRLAATGDLSAPPLSSLDALSIWVDERSAIAVAVALARLGAELAAWYTLALGALHGLAAVPGLAASGRLAAALAPPGVTRAIHAALGVGLAASIALGADDAPDGAPTTATMRPVTDPVPGTATMSPAPNAVGTATMRPLDPAAESGTAGGARRARPTSWTVAPGESFWSIAAELRADELGRAPSDAEIDPRWRALVDANRHRLVDPGDPDLIVAGQVFEVPAG